MLLQHTLTFLILFLCLTLTETCPTSCLCGTVRKKNLVHCNKKDLYYFPRLNEFPPASHEIYLQNNHIQYLPHEKGMCSEVWLIDISGNNIRSIEGNQLGKMFPKLSTLDLSKNRIKYLQSNTFIQLDQLNNLNLAKNVIINIDKKAFDNLKSLNILNLAFNEITDLNLRWFKYLQSLNTISVAHNKIQQEVNSKNDWPVSLRYVHLNNNSISLLTKIPKYVSKFDLSDNPLYCVCKPDSFEIENILETTLCKVSLKCIHGILLNPNGECVNENLSKKDFAMWRRFSEKPQCQKPVIKDLRFSKDRHGTPQLSCVASGTPAPDVALVHNETKQKMTVTGVEESNKTFVAQSNVKPGIYFCQAKSVVGKTEDSIKLYRSQLLVDDTKSDIDYQSSLLMSATGFITTEHLTVTSQATFTFTISSKLPVNEASKAIISNTQSFL